MIDKINKVAVLGTGVMGAQIAAHLTNVKIPVYSFDMNQEVSESGIANCQKLKPSPFYNPKSSELITCYNYEDNLDKLSECDWIIEVISERLDWKQDLYKKITPHINSDAIITSNTSGISLSDLTSEMNEDIISRFFITHFFNPPRYMKLVEIICSSKTDKEYVDFMDIFLQETLGKGVVHAKDTPNFIANRIGTYGMMVTLDEAYKRKISIEDVDALTGSIIGRPKSATFRTADIVGLDTMKFVAETAYNNCLDDSERELFKLPEYLLKMVENKWLGQKTKQGFYKKIDKGIIYSLDLETLDYKPMNKKRYAAIALAKEKTHLRDRLNTIVRSDDVAGDFLWNVISRSLLYAANNIGEISDDIVSIDNALKWGFGWELGPFEVLDAIGLEYFVERVKADGSSVPSWMSDMLDSGFTCMYVLLNGKKEHYSIQDKNYVPLKYHEKELYFDIIKSKNNVIKKHWSASLVDLDDGVAAIELHSVLKPELNPIDGSMTEMLKYGLDWVEENNYKGLIISGSGSNFCAGANLAMVLQAAEKKDFDSIEHLTNGLQQVFQLMRYSKFPVVGAPYGLVLGGGMEMIGGCNTRIAAAESYIGLVEVGVGLIPGAGGNLRLLSHLSKKIKTKMPGSMSVVQKAFETIGFAKVATSAKQAQSFGYMTSDDKVVVNRSHLLHEAKMYVLNNADSFIPPEPETFKLIGSAGRLAIKTAAKGMVKAGKISEHDSLIGEKLAFVLTGGSKGGPFTAVSEQYLLDIEREAFVSLCGEQKSIDRIKFMLTKGKPLRN